MGIADRDYYREPEGWKNPFSSSQVTLCLIFTCILVFFAQVATLPPRFQAGPNPLGLTSMLELSGEAVFRGDVWRVLTYGFIHHPQDIIGLIATTIMLIWFGRTVEEELGSREFFALIFVSIIGGGLAFTLYAAISAAPIGTFRGSVCLITVLMTLFVVRNPYRHVMVFGIVPVPAWLVLVLYVAFSIMNHGQHMLVPALLSAQFFCVVFAYTYERSHVRILNWLPTRERRPKPRPNHPKLRLFQESLEPEPEPATASVSNGNSSSKLSAYVGLDEHFEAKLDEVLEKMNRTGKASLTDSEQQVLLRASEYYKKRRQSNEE